MYHDFPLKFYNSIHEELKVDTQKNYISQLNQNYSPLGKQYDRMKYLLFSFCILISFQVNAQKTRVITDTKTNEVYSVLIDSPTIKHGSYKLLNNKLVIEKGFYNHGIKDSIWTTFRNDKKASEGPYKNDKKVGVWSYFEKGKLIQKYDEDKSELLKFTWPNLADTNKYFKVFHQGDFVLVHLDSPPMFKGGNEAMKVFMNEHMNYPKEAQTKRIFGEVIVTFTINKKGKISNYLIKKGIGGGCDEEAIRLIQLTDGNWISGILKTRKVEVEYEVPIMFNLPK